MTMQCQTTDKWQVQAKGVIFNIANNRAMHNAHQGVVTLQRMIERMNCVWKVRGKILVRTTCVAHASVWVTYV